MKFKVIYRILFIFIFFSLNVLLACSKNSDYPISVAENENDGNEITDEPIIWGDGIERGYKRTSILDLALIYQGGVQRVDWTPAEMYPYVVHTDISNKKDWFFDGFLFLEFQDGKGYNFNPGYTGNKNARKQEWEWLIARHFEDGKAIKSLNECIERSKAELGTPSFKHKVVIGLPEPFLNQKDWGELNGKALDFSNREDRITACKWYIDELVKHFKASNLNNLELEGFYWVSEHMSTNYYITVDIGNYIREQNRKFFWIPYYMSNGFSQWKEYGFDIAYLQPNYFFDDKIGDDRVNNACDLAFTHNMGVEMEFDTKALVNSPKNYRYRLENYIKSFEKKDVLKNSSIAYYEGGRGLYAFSQSKEMADRKILDQLHSIVKERRERMLEKTVYEQDFKKQRIIDEKVWNVAKSNIRTTVNGLEISSGGNITKLNTAGKIDMKYGRIEVRAKILSKSNDTQLKIHMMPTENKLGVWPSSGELFLMNFKSSKPTAVHVGANTDKMNENLNNLKESVFYLNDLVGSSHTFVCEWSEKKIVFYVDGLKVNIQEDLFNKIYSDYPKFWPFNEKFFFEISVQSKSKDPVICIESVKLNKE